MRTNSSTQYHSPKARVWVSRNVMPITMLKNSLLLILLFATSCGKPSAGSFADKFGKIPKGCEIQEFWFSGAGMDHCYLWKIKFEKIDTINSWLQSKKIQEANDCEFRIEENIYPKWWNNSKINPIDYSCYEKIIGNKFVYFYIDEANKIIFAQWHDT